MITPQHTEEGLSRACVQAITAMAGFNISVSQLDYGVDATFDEVSYINGRRIETGYSLKCQLKASASPTKWGKRDDHIFYDLEAKAYNDLVRWRGAIPYILIFLGLPPNREDWLKCSENEVTIGGGCYWAYLRGEPTSNKNTHRIYIPCSQQLLPQELTNLFNKVKLGELQP